MKGSDKIRDSEKGLREAIKKNVNSPFSDYLISLIKASIRIKPNFKKRRIDQLSKIGGVPLIQKGTEWPRTTVLKNAYSFIMQLNLEELSEYDLEKKLPEKGLLSFYLDLTGNEEGKVVYNEKIENLELAKLPIEYEKKIKNYSILEKLFHEPISFEFYKEQEISLNIEYQIPSIDSLELELFHERMGIGYDELEMTDLFMTEYFKGIGEDHHLLGYYIGYDDSVYELFLDEECGEIKLDKKSIEKGLEWKLLLQIDSDILLGMNWDDDGKLLFFIKDEDLKMKKFENVRILMDLNIK